ncbi:uncharacterized protein [Musca autumnalis]|uniref:uncharacterized protein n=1 Tax=Musca autumnalis TaxID=221902 RepID=UPI003CF3BDD3
MVGFMNVRSKFRFFVDKLRVRPHEKHRIEVSFIGNCIVSVVYVGVVVVVDDGDHVMWVMLCFVWFCSSSSFEDSATSTINDRQLIKSEQYHHKWNDSGNQYNSNEYSNML